MRNTVKLLGIIALVAVIGFTMTACDELLPTIPQGVSAVRDTTTPTTVIVQWNLISNATSYNIYYSTVGGEDEGELEGQINSRPYNSADKDANEIHYFSVAAVNGVGEGPRSAWVSVGPVGAELLAAPTNVDAVRDTATPSIITVTWDAVTGADSYNVYWSSTGTDDGQIDNDTDIIETTFESTNNPTNIINYFRVTAVNSAGEGTPSAWIPVEPVVGTLPAPTGVNAERDSTIPTTVTVTWSAVTGADNYNVYWSGAGGVAVGQLEGSPVGTTFDSTGNNTELTHYFKVAAVDNTGEGASSAWIPVGPVAPVPAIQAGLYLGAPETITPSSTRIATVGQNNLTQTFTYVNNAANALAGEYTLYLDNEEPLTLGATTLSANVKLTIIGLGSERTITATAAGDMFAWPTSNGDTVSLTLGENITLQGRATAATSSLIWVRGGGTFTMLEGSKITGHTTSSTQGTVYLISSTATNSTFNMKGGIITGNHTSNTGSDIAGGVLVTTGGAFNMTSGSITGNTRGASMQPLDVYVRDLTLSANRTGGIIGVANPPTLAGGGTEPVLGLYAGTPGSITASSVPIATIPPHVLNSTVVNYVRDNPGPHTLLVGVDLTANGLYFETGDLTIVGVGGERIITTASNGRAFVLERTAGGGNLTLGNNITIQGRAGTVSVIRVRNNNSFTMLAGSKIIGSTNSHATDTGAVYVAVGATFTMDGGEITGNHSSSTNASAAGGVHIVDAASKFIMTGGTITGNTRGTSEEAMDVYFAHAAAFTFFNENKTGGTIGTTGVVGIIPEAAEFTSTDSDGNEYVLVITENLSTRSVYNPRAGDNYILTIKSASQPDRVSSGTVTTAGDNLSLQPSVAGAAPFTVNTSGGQMTAIDGNIRFDSGASMAAPGAVTPAVFECPHLIDEWGIALPAHRHTMTAAGTETGTCTICTATITRPLPSGQSLISSLSGSDARLTLYLAFGSSPTAIVTDILTRIGSSSVSEVTLDLSGSTGTFDPLRTNTDSSVLSGKAKIKSIILPSTATGIPIGAFNEGTFANFTILESVSGDGVTAISNNAFRNNFTLKSVSFPNVTSIGTSAFQGATSLANVDMPKVTSIGIDAFRALEETILGVLFFWEVPIKEINMPLVTTIGANAFRGSLLEKAIFPLVLNIPNGAFQYSNVKEVDFPIATAIGNSAFQDTKLEAIEFPLVGAVGFDAFRDCGALANVGLPLAVTIGANAFNGAKLTGIVVLPFVTTISQGTFQDSGLLNIVLLSATSVAASAFRDCTFLLTVTMPNVTSIANNAFDGCTALMAVIIPSITSIGGQAFANTGSLPLSIVMGERAPALTGGIFLDVSLKIVTVLIPLSSEDYGYSVTGPPDNPVPNIWGNGLRGRGWNRGATSGGSLGSGTLNPSITVNIQVGTLP